MTRQTALALIVLGDVNHTLGYVNRLTERDLRAYRELDAQARQENRCERSGR